VLLSNSIFIYSQEYFNFRFEYGQTGWWDGATNVFQLPDGYIVGGGHSYYGPMNLGFYKIDFQGNKLFSKIYGDTVDEYYLGNPGSIVRLNDTIIVASGSRNSPAPNWVHQEGLIYFLNNDFDTLFTRCFGEKVQPIDTEYLFYQIKTLPTKEIISVGGKMPYGLATRAILVKTDQFGNELWEKAYWDGMYDQGHSVICTTDGGYAIGGFEWEPQPPPNLTGDPIVIKTDSAGNKQWFKNYGTPLIDSRGMICSTQDGNMVLGFCYCDSMDQMNPIRRINLIKIDNAGSTVWNKKYGESAWENTLHNIRENPDGTLISTGITTKFFPTAYKYVGWILKTTADGDSLWYRQYDICKGEETYNWLYDVIETPDKGYLACGVVYPEPPDTGSQDGWILKVDSLGCEQADYCWVGMKEEHSLPVSAEIEVFPNPAENEMNFNLRVTEQNVRLDLCLYDIFGREVKKLPLSQGQTGLRMDVSDLAPGLYVAVVKSDNRIIARKKLVKRE